MILESGTIDERKRCVFGLTIVTAFCGRNIVLPWPDYDTHNANLDGMCGLSDCLYCGPRNVYMEAQIQQLLDDCGSGND